MRLSSRLLTCAFFSTALTLWSGHSHATEASAGGALLEVIKARHSGRSYDSKRPVSESQIRAMMEAARWAPSCYGDEPWRFIICHKETHPEAYEKVFKSLVEFNQGWAKDAPILIVVIARTTFKKNGKENAWGPYDTGAAAQNMMLEASAMGLMAHQMGGFDEEALKKSFNITGDYRVMAVMAVGYEADPARTPEARLREPLEKLFYHGQWPADPA